MTELISIAIAAVIVLAVGLPIVCIFDKWKKETQQAEKNECR